MMIMTTYDDPFVKRNIFEKLFEYFKRNLQKDNLAAQSKRLQHEHANDISQEYLDGKRKKTKMAAKRRSETGNHYNQIDTGNSGFLGGGLVEEKENTLLGMII